MNLDETLKYFFYFKVYGALPVTRQGSFAEYCSAGEAEVEYR